jgi:diacylglycerol O-acyltransferase / wax synthase
VRSNGEPLSALDAFFLYLEASGSPSSEPESSTTPMHSGSLAILEGAPLLDRSGRLRIGAIRDEIESRLNLVPKLRWRVAVASMPQLLPYWVDDPSFDVRRHVKKVSLEPPGDEEQLRELCARILARPLDRDHPLWEIWFVEGLEGGRVGIVEKLHHALADGLAGVEIATVLLDPVRHLEGHPVPVPWSPRPAPGDPAVLLRRLAHVASAPWRLLGTGIGAARHPRNAAVTASRAIGAVASLVTPRTLAPRCSLNTKIGCSHRVALVRQRLQDLQLVERSFGVTLNDVLLCAVGGGLHRLLTARGEQDQDELQVLVPVATGAHSDRELGNRVSAMFVRVAVGEMDEGERLRRVSRSTARSKGHHQAMAGDLLLDLLDPLPRPVLEAGTRLVHRQPFVNLVVTDVPGPSKPLYALGAHMLEAFPFVPLGGNLAVGVAALSYDGELGIGLMADRQLVSDLDEFAAGIENSLGVLVRCARPDDLGRATCAADEVV